MKERTNNDGEPNIKHSISDGAARLKAVIKPSEPKRQKMDEPNQKATQNQGLVEQKFGTSVAKPPDIDYRTVPRHDMEQIKFLKEKDFHVERRIAHYQTQVAELVLPRLGRRQT